MKIPKLLKQNDPIQQYALVLTSDVEIQTGSKYNIFLLIDTTTNKEQNATTRFLKYSLSYTLNKEKRRLLGKLPCKIILHFPPPTKNVLGKVLQTRVQISFTFECASLDQ